LNADFGTALSAALAQNTTATDGLHTLTKTMYFLTLTLVRLKSSFHEKTTIPLNLGSRGTPSLISIAETGEKSDDSILLKS
jgi:hypothetical protein